MIIAPDVRGWYCEPGFQPCFAVETVLLFTSTIPYLHIAAEWLSALSLFVKFSAQALLLLDLSMCMIGQMLHTHSILCACASLYLQNFGFTSADVRRVQCCLCLMTAEMSSSKPLPPWASQRFGVRRKWIAEWFYWPNGGGLSCAFNLSYCDVTWR